MAQGGYTCAETALEGARGFVHVLSSSPRPAALSARLGTVYDLLGNTYKPYACGLVIHPSLDGCAQLRTRHGLRGPEIERIDLRVHRFALELTGKPAPATGLEGKFSVFHGAAVGIIDGEGGEAQFSDTRVTSPDVVALRQRVHARIDEALDKDQAVVNVLCRNGDCHELRVEHCRGSLERPLTDAALDAKFLALSQPVLGAVAAAQALAALRGIADASSAADAIQLLRRK